MSIGVSTSTKPSASSAVRSRRFTARADAQVALHRRAPEIEVAVAQPQHLVDVGAVVERERDRLRLRQHGEREPAATSTSPVGISSLTVPSGRARTTPSICSTHSPRTRCTPSQPGVVGSTTTCTMPATSRRSRNTTPPWSRRCATQPQSVTSLPMSPLRTVARPVRAHHRVARRSPRVRARSHSVDFGSRGTSTWSPDRRSFTATAPASASGRRQHHAVGRAGLVGGRPLLLAERPP